MYAVVTSNGRFNGAVYTAITMAIVAHHAQYGESLAEVEAAPTQDKNPDGDLVYGGPTEAQTGAVTAWINKQNKAAEISAITVDVDALVFDGDEDSQAIMERHANTMAAEGLDTIPWKLADNSFADVTAEQLNQAVMLAAAAQRAIVVKYG